GGWGGPDRARRGGEAEAGVGAAEPRRVGAAARLSGIRAQRLEAEAKLAADEATYQRLKSASATPGVVAGNDVEVAQRSVEAGKAPGLTWHGEKKGPPGPGPGPGGKGKGLPRGPRARRQHPS